jgi:HEAT repeat protein
LIAILKGEESADRASAILAMGSTQNPRFIRILIGAFKDRSAASRGYAAYALSEIGSATVEPLIATLGDRRFGDRWSAAYALSLVKRFLFDGANLAQKRY